MNNKHIGESWENIRQQLFTPTEIAVSDLKVAIISEIVKARQEKGLSQKDLEVLSGVKQPIIARLEKGTTNPRIDTILKLLAPLGKTLVLADIQPKKKDTIN